jgi:hypothetical protein
MRPKERAWMVAGHRVETERELTFPQVWAAQGQSAVLFLPQQWAGDSDIREAAFGWAMAELVEQRGGWLFLVRRLIYFAHEFGRIASAVAVALGGVFVL